MRLFSGIIIFFIISQIPTIALATTNSVSTTFQIWDGLDVGKIQIREVPMVVSGAEPENQIIAVAKSTQPLQTTEIPVVVQRSKCKK